MSKKAKQTYFLDSWLTDSEFCKCVAPAESYIEAKCTLCKVSIKVSNMSFAPLRSHAKK